MAKFHFKLLPLQRYREQYRDVCRQGLARVLAEDAELLQRREELTAAREGVMAELLQLQNENRLNVDQTVARRFHAAQLTTQIRQLDMQREEVAVRMHVCRQALAKADQEVKVLEQLAEKQELEFRKVLEARESREREEVWQAGQLRVDWQ
ncbi:MAG: hypothetical protein SFV23_19145 [Planctomycetaceae bacterium]|nr:hypothetical protein [Planctomycetaceae bacterium]